MFPDETAEQAAERILQGTLISCSTPFTFKGEVDWFSNPTFNQYKEWTWQLSRHPEWGILAERYRATGDERFAEAFVRFFKSWVKQAVVPENADGGATLCWRTIEAGIRMGGVWQWALHSFYRSPAFTDDVLIDWYKSIWEHAWRLRNFHRTGNWLIMEMNGLAQIGILYPQFKEASAWKQYAFDRMVDELDAQIYPDGFQVELSTGYHQVDIHNYQWLMDVCKAYDVKVPDAFMVGMEKMHAVNIQMMLPDGRLPDLNDGGWHEVADLMTSAVQDFPYRADFLWAFSRGSQGKPPANTSYAFPYAGYVLLRSGWEKDAFCAVFDGGHFGYGHQHEDKLNVLLHAYGRLLLTEAGNYAYDASEMRVYVLSTRAHNTVRIDGEDQNRRLNYSRETFDVRQPSNVKWQFGDVQEFAESTYNEGYGVYAERKVTHTRRLIFVRQPPKPLSPFWITIDRLVPVDSKNHRGQWLWHFNSTSVVVDGVKAASADPAQPNLTIVPTFHPGMTTKIILGQETPEWQGWKAIKNHQQGEYTPIATAAIELDFGSPLRLVTVLYPTPAGMSCPVVSVQASPEIDNRSLTLMLADGTHIDLAED